MIQELSLVLSSVTDPYQNLAMEEYLTFHVNPGECVMYLWQNAHTVVIGRNQNCWKECRVSELEDSGGHLVRRLSGGGAVYHDLGNLNFTFCMRKQEANVAKQLRVILEALASFGLKGEFTGRNDLTVNGRKFSGNAFFDSKGFYYHHGTLLLSADTVSMSRYLNPSGTKLQSKGVNSIRSRVVNLSELSPKINVESMKRAMISAFGKIYQREVKPFDVKRFDVKKMDILMEQFRSCEWNYGRRIPFTNQVSRHFSWGEVELSLRVSGGCVEEAFFSSDSMEAEWFDRIGSRFQGCLYEPDALCEVMKKVLIERKVPVGVCGELCEMIKEGL